MKKSSIGGQAVLEGVMMKSSHNMAIAVRTEKGDIALHEESLKPLAEKKKALRVPIVRGAVNMVDMMGLGVRVLTTSMDMAGMQEEEPSRFEKWLAKKTGKDIMDIATPFAVVLAVVLAIGLFIVVPSLVVRLLQQWISQPMVINLIEGAVRLLIFVLYLWAISRMKDIQRLLAYHGAEHKVINCYEHDLPLTVENAGKSSRLHPRCGTSFLFLIMIISVAVFTCLGTITSLWLRVLSRIALLPVVAGVSYECLKALAKSEGKLARALRVPGMWMQRFTTREPDEGMLQVAIASFEAVQRMDAAEAEAKKQAALEEAAARAAALRAARAPQSPAEGTPAPQDEMDAQLAPVEEADAPSDAETGTSLSGAQAEQEASMPAQGARAAAGTSPQASCPSQKTDAANAPGATQQAAGEALREAPETDASKADGTHDHTGAAL
nr:DUF1385 domain-containing protein [Maliibacterium massiliense]